MKVPAWNFYPHIWSPNLPWAWARFRTAPLNCQRYPVLPDKEERSHLAFYQCTVQPWGCRSALWVVQHNPVEELPWVFQNQTVLPEVGVSFRSSLPVLFGLMVRVFCVSCVSPSIEMTGSSSCRHALLWVAFATCLHSPGGFPVNRRNPFTPFATVNLTFFPSLQILSTSQSPHWMERSSSARRGPSFFLLASPASCLLHPLVLQSHQAPPPCDQAHTCKGTHWTGSQKREAPRGSSSSFPDDCRRQTVVPNANFCRKADHVHWFLPPFW